jgi:hypothetical protein
MGRQLSHLDLPSFLEVLLQAFMQGDAAERQALGW